jgi:hypothetical protein
VGDLSEEQLRAIEFRHRDCTDCDEALMAREIVRHRAMVKRLEAYLDTMDSAGPASTSRHHARELRNRMKEAGNG